MLLLTENELKSHQDSSACYICRKKKLHKNLQKIKITKKLETCHFTGRYKGATHSIFNLRFNVPNEVPAVFHNGLKNNYHFIMKELASSFEDQFEFLKYRKVKNFFSSNRKRNEKS